MGRWRPAAFLLAAALFGAAGSDGPASPLNGADLLDLNRPPLVGFSFSPTAVPLGIDPRRGLAELLDILQPDLVRLPVYWDEVAPEPTTLDFSEVDELIETVAAHDAQLRSRLTRIVLVIGARNIAYPEIHAPAWIDAQETTPLSTLLRSPAYHDYLVATIRRYAALPTLDAWQLENEPLDNVKTLGPNSTAVSQASVRSEARLLRSLDPMHPVAVTTFDSAHVSLDRQGASPLAWLYDWLPGPKPVGHPSQALALGDILGLDAYAVTPATPLGEAGTSLRIAWKADALAYWATQAHRHGKPLWVTEMQASPWDGIDDFTPGDLVSSALAYRRSGAGVFLLWGVESWLNSRDWMSAGLASVNVLRS